jgi:predicted aconitase
MLSPDIRYLMTNSAKYAYYAPGLLNTAVTYGRLEDCVASAVGGTIQRDDTIWSG